MQILQQAWKSHLLSCLRLAYGGQAQWELKASGGGSPGTLRGAKGMAGSGGARLKRPLVQMPKPPAVPPAPILDSCWVLRAEIWGVCTRPAPSKASHFLLPLLGDKRWESRPWGRRGN